MVGQESKNTLYETLNEEINDINLKYGLNLKVKYQDWHDDSEVDEYNTYRIYDGDRIYTDSIGPALSLGELDVSVCVIDEMMEYLSKSGMLTERKKDV